MTEDGLEVLKELLEEMPSQRPWTENTTNFYRIALSGIPDPEVVAAVGQLLRTEQYRPMPAQIISVITQKSMTGQMGFSEGYEEASRLRNELGRNAAPHPSFPDRYPNIRALGPPTFSNPVIGLTINSLGGWMAFCGTETENRHAEIAQFRRAWDDQQLAIARKVGTGLSQRDGIGRWEITQPALETGDEGDLDGTDA